MPTRYIQRGQPPVYLGTGNSPAPPGVASVGVDDSVGSIFYWKGGDGVRHQIAGSGGAAATVTQGTDKGTTVVKNGAVVDITLNNASLTTVTHFTFTNTSIGAGDSLVFNHISGGTLGSYLFSGVPGVGTADIYIRNVSGGALAEAVVVRVAVLKGGTAA